MILRFTIINVTLTISYLHPVHAELRLPENGKILDVIDGGCLDIEDWLPEADLLNYPTCWNLLEDHLDVTSPCAPRIRQHRLTSLLGGKKEAGAKEGASVVASSLHAHHLIGESTNQNVVLR